MKPIELGQSCQLSVTVPFDGQVQLDLPVFSAGGYLWRFDQAGEGLLVRVQGEGRVAEEAEPLVIGSGSREHWCFQPVRPGKVTLTLVNHRPWNGETLNTVTVDVDIQAP